MAAPTYVTGASDLSQGANGTSFTWTWADVGTPTANDVAAFWMQKESSAAYTATPSGWNQLSGAPWVQDTGGFKFQDDLWWKRLTGSESGVDTWSWTGSTWRFADGVVYRSLITSEIPLIGAVVEEESAQNTQPGHPGITVTRSNSGLLWLVGNFSNINSSTDPSGFTLRTPTGSNAARETRIFDNLAASLGASGSVSSTLGDPEYALSVLLEMITEAAAAAQDTPELRSRRQMSQLLVM